MPQNSGQGPRPRHSTPPFLLLLLLLQEGEALGGSGRKGKRLDPAAAISPRRACSSPSPGGRGAGCSRSAQADQESPARGRGYSKCGLAHLTLTHIFRN